MGLSTLATGTPIERLLQRAALAGAVLGREVPAGGRDDLVLGDLAVGDLQPVAQRAARRLGQALAVAVAGIGAGRCRRSGRRGSAASQSRMARAILSASRARARWRSMTEMPLV